MSHMIQSIVNAAPPLEAGGVRGASQARRPEEEPQTRPQTPVMDEYIPEEEREASGLYWPGKDEDGRPKIYFDDPGKKPPGRASGGGGETCTGNTDAVDREIERLKRRQRELEQQIHSETDGDKVRSLERELARVERELSRKDNDAYRRRHTVFT